MPTDAKRKRMVVEEVVTETAPEKSVDPTPSASDTPMVESVSSESTNVETPIVESSVVEEPILNVTEPEVVVEPPSESVTVDAQPESEIKEEEHFSIQEPTNNDFSGPLPELKNSNSASPLVIIIPGIFLLGALLGGIYFYQKSIGPITTPTPTPAVVNAVESTPVPTSSPSASLDLTKYPINIMNGSGIVGEAAKVKTLIEAGGFKVSKTGNASSYDFTKTVIKAKADVPASYLEKLTTTLSKTYVLDASQVLAISSPDSVQVIIGSTKAK